jgi:hypothetical protein
LKGGMKKQQSAFQKRTRDEAEKQGPSGSVGRHRLNLIKAPSAPALIHSEEVGAPIAQDQAIREKMRLYPRATVNEIVGMFELEGVKVLPEAVKKVKRK